MYIPFDDLKSGQEVNQAIESGVRPSLCRKVNICVIDRLINNQWCCRILTLQFFKES